MTQTTLLRHLNPQITTPRPIYKTDNEQLQKHLSRCLENRTRIESPMSEISDKEVDYGSFESIANPATDSDRAWSPSEIDSQDQVTRVYRLVKPQEQR